MPSDTPPPEAPGANARYIRALLNDYLPPPVTHTAEARTERDQHAMDAVTALHPEDDFEASLAVRLVAMGAHADDCLRLAGVAAADSMEMRRCRAQAIAMARQADAQLRMLLRVQATREKADAASAPHVQGERRGMHKAEAAQPWPAEPDLTEREIDAEAELYAVMYPDRAARIRAASGLPPDLDFGPPEPHIVVGLLRSCDASRAVGLNPGNRDNETGSMPLSGSAD
ncbi:MAG TPA: hypothetical protein VFL55_07570 [Acetobacteraceae bacterium]|nr:hypothetical protein [Acetobacteraceae bacterium]